MAAYTRRVQFLRAISDCFRKRRSRNATRNWLRRQERHFPTGAPKSDAAGFGRGLARLPKKHHEPNRIDILPLLGKTLPTRLGVGNEAGTFFEKTG